MNRTICALLLMMAALMSAAPAAANTSMVDTSRTGSITVTKLSGDPATQFGDPNNPNADLDRTPIPGLDFVARKVTTIDLGTNKGWVDAARLRPRQLVSGGERADELGDPIHARTDADGKALFTDLPVGLYYIEEVPSEAQRNSTTVANPMIVAVPTTDPTSRDRWIYDVEVQAKNQKLVATKAVNRKTVEGGEEIEYGITTLTPEVDVRGNISRLEIVDPLARDLSYVEDSAVMHFSDYNGTFEPIEFDEFDTTVNKGILTFTLRQEALEKLARLRRGNPGVNVTVKFKAVVNLGKVFEDKIRNKAYTLVEGYPEFDPEDPSGVPTNEVVTIVTRDGTPIDLKEPDGDVVDIPVPVPVDGKEEDDTVFVPEDDDDSGNNGGGSSGSSDDPKKNRFWPPLIVFIPPKIEFDSPGIDVTPPRLIINPDDGADPRDPATRSEEERTGDASSNPIERLANTGAGVVTIVLLGSVLVGLGIILLSTRRFSRRDN